MPGRRTLLALALVLLGVGAAAGAAAALVDGGSSPPSPSSEVTVVFTTATPPPTTTPGTAVPSPAPSSTPSPTPAGSGQPPPDERLRGFTMPIAGACLPSSDTLLPNAARPYRNGFHEGIDFYDGYVCVRVYRGTEVVAAKDGTVVRADHDYQPITAAEMERLLSRVQDEGYTPPEVLDRLRGRQVWIDHGGGIITRYAHLLDIAPGVEEGVFVRAGQVIGYVGNSGTPDGVSNPDVENHLHFEIRIDGGYLGQGLAPGQVRALLERVFRP